MTKNDINNVISLMNRNDNLCQGAAQQVSNGFYRCYDMLHLLISELDEKGTCAGKLSSINSTYNYNDRMSQSAPQQSVNGSYRIVELLEVLIGYFDESGTKRFAVSSVKSNLTRNDNLCQSSPQQMVNGSYRIVDMLEILVDLIAPAMNRSVGLAISAMNRMDAMTNGAPQQTANGTSTIAEITRLLVQHFDADNRYRFRLNSIVSLMERNNNLCQGADQQSGNYLYRTVEMLAILGECLLDKAQKRIEAYWQEHADLRSALEAEKAQQYAHIREIENEARQVNDGGEIAPLKRRISEKTNEMMTFGQSDLVRIQHRIDGLKSEKSAAGFFDFKKKKAIQEQIDAAESELYAKRQEIKKMQSAIQSEIDGLNSQIQRIEARVEAQRKSILAKCSPYRARIQEIDRQFTRRR